MNIIRFAGALTLATFTLRAAPVAPESLREGEAKQQQLAGDAQKLVAQLEATLGEYERNGLAGEDVDVVKKMRDSLDRLSASEMLAVVDLLQKARAASDAGVAKKTVSDAYARQKQILTQMKQLLAEHGRQQEAIELSQALAQLADRQAANLQNGIALGKWAGAKKAENLAAAMQANLDGQTSEQVALAAELKLAAQKIARFAKDPGHAEMAQRFQQAAAEAQRVQPAADAAAAMLKEGQLFKAAVEEKAARDALRRLAKQIAPPQSPAEALRTAERELGKMIAEENAIAAEAQQAVGENLVALENGQGDLATKSDVLAQDLAAQAPNAAQAIRAALEKMQDARAAMIDKVAADAAQNAQAALANLEQARGEVAQLAMRAAAPAQQPNMPPAAQQLAAAEKQAGELAKIIEAEQKLELETAKIVAQALPNMNGLFKGLDVRQADLRAQTGDLKAALAGDPAEATDALNDAGRDMGTAKSALEKPDGPAADAAERKALADLYRALHALGQKIAQAGEQIGGNEAAEAKAMVQTAAQLAQAQAALAEAQRDLQKADAAQQAGQANAGAMQQAAAALAQAAQQAGKGAAEARVMDDVAQRAMQDAAQDAADGSAQAAAGHAPAAQAKAGSAQAKLAQAATALAQAQAGLAASATPPMPGEGPQSGLPGASKPGGKPGAKPGQPGGTPGMQAAQNSQPGGGQAIERGSRTVASARANFTGLPPRDRAAIEQAQSEKYPEEYGALVEQYLRNLADESTRK